MLTLSIDYVMRSVGMLIISYFLTVFAFTNVIMISLIILIRFIFIHSSPDIITSSCPMRGAIGSLVVYKNLVYKEWNWFEKRRMNIAAAHVTVSPNRRSNRRSSNDTPRSCPAASNATNKNNASDTAKTSEPASQQAVKQQDDTHSEPSDL